MRDLIERGFEVAVVRDATAGARLPGADTYEAALINFRMIASSVPTTEDVVAQLGRVAAHAQRKRCSQCTGLRGVAGPQPRQA